MKGTVRKFLAVLLATAMLWTTVVPALAVGEDSLLSMNAASDNADKKPGAVAEEQSEEDTEAQPEEQSEESAEAQPEEQSEENAEEQSEESTEGKTEEQLEESAEDQPEEDTEEQPEESTEGKTEEQPEESAEDQPEEDTEEQPEESAEEKTEEQSEESAEEQPGEVVGEQTEEILEQQMFDQTVSYDAALIDIQTPALEGRSIDYDGQPHDASSLIKNNHAEITGISFVDNSATVTNAGTYQITVSYKDTETARIAYEETVTATINRVTVPADKVSSSTVAKYTYTGEPQVIITANAPSVGSIEPKYTFTYTHTADGASETVTTTPSTDPKLRVTEAGVYEITSFKVDYEDSNIDNPPDYVPHFKTSTIEKAAGTWPTLTAESNLAWTSEDLTVAQIANGSDGAFYPVKVSYQVKNGNAVVLSGTDVALTGSLSIVLPATQAFPGDYTIELTDADFGGSVTRPDTAAPSAEFTIGPAKGKAPAVVAKTDTYGGDDIVAVITQEPMFDQYYGKVYYTVGGSAPMSDTSPTIQVIALKENDPANAGEHADAGDYEVKIIKVTYSNPRLISDIPEGDSSLPAAVTGVINPAPLTISAQKGAADALTYKEGGYAPADCVKAKLSGFVRGDEYTLKDGDYQLLMVNEPSNPATVDNITDVGSYKFIAEPTDALRDALPNYSITSDDYVVEIQILPMEGSITQPDEQTVPYRSSGYSEADIREIFGNLTITATDGDGKTVTLQADDYDVSVVDNSDDTLVTTYPLSDAGSYTCTLTFRSGSEVYKTVLLSEESVAAKLTIAKRRVSIQVTPNNQSYRSFMPYHGTDFVGEVCFQDEESYAQPDEVTLTKSDYAAALTADDGGHALSGADSATDANADSTGATYPDDVDYNVVITLNDYDNLSKNYEFTNCDSGRLLVHAAIKASKGRIRVNPGDGSHITDGDSLGSATYNGAITAGDFATFDNKVTIGKPDGSTLLTADKLSGKYTVTVTDSEGAEITDYDAPLDAGTYTVRVQVTDATMLKNCELEKNPIELTYTIDRIPLEWDMNASVSVPYTAASYGAFAIGIVPAVGRTAFLYSSEVKVKAKNQGDTAPTLVPETDYTVAFDPADTEASDAGDYKVVVTPTEAFLKNYELDRNTYDYGATIRKMPITLSVTLDDGQELAYDPALTADDLQDRLTGIEVCLHFDLEAGDTVGHLTVNGEGVAKLSEGEYALSAKPVGDPTFPAVGSYNLVATPSEGILDMLSKNFELDSPQAESARTFSVVPLPGEIDEIAGIEVVFDPAASYTGDAVKALLPEQGVTVSAMDDNNQKTTVALTAEDFEVSLPEGKTALTDVGDYTVTLTVKPEADAYKNMDLGREAGKDGKAFTFTIKPRKMTVSVTAPDYRIYVPDGWTASGYFSATTVTLVDAGEAGVPIADVTVPNDFATFSFTDDGQPLTDGKAVAANSLDGGTIRADVSGFQPYVGSVTLRNTWADYGNYEIVSASNHDESGLPHKFDCFIKVAPATAKVYRYGMTNPCQDGMVRQSLPDDYYGWSTVHSAALIDRVELVPTVSGTGDPQALTVDTDYTVKLLSGGNEVEYMKDAGNYTVRIALDTTSVANLNYAVDPATIDLSYAILRTPATLAVTVADPMPYKAEEYAAEDFVASVTLTPTAGGDTYAKTLEPNENQYAGSEPAYAQFIYAAQADGTEALLDAGEYAATLTLGQQVRNNYAIIGTGYDATNGTYAYTAKITPAECALSVVDTLEDSYPYDAEGVDVKAGITSVLVKTEGDKPVQEELWPDSCALSLYAKGEGDPTLVEGDVATALGEYIVQIDLNAPNWQIAPWSEPQNGWTMLVDQDSGAVSLMKTIVIEPRGGTLVIDDPFADVYIGNENLPFGIADVKVTAVGVDGDTTEAVLGDGEYTVTLNTGADEASNEGEYTATLTLTTDKWAFIEEEGTTDLNGWTKQGDDLTTLTKSFRIARMSGTLAVTDAGDWAYDPEIGRDAAALITDVRFAQDQQQAEDMGDMPLENLAFENYEVTITYDGEAGEKGETDSVDVPGAYRVEITPTDEDYSVTGLTVGSENGWSWADGKLSKTFVVAKRPAGLSVATVDVTYDGSAHEAAEFVEGVSLVPVAAEGETVATRTLKADEYSIAFKEAETEAIEVDAYKLTANISEALTVFYDVEAAEADGSIIPTKGELSVNDIEDREYTANAGYGAAALVPFVNIDGVPAAMLAAGQYSVTIKGAVDGEVDAASNVDSYTVTVTVTDQAVIDRYGLTEDGATVEKTFQITPQNAVLALSVGTGDLTCDDSEHTAADFAPSATLKGDTDGEIEAAPVYSLDRTAREAGSYVLTATIDDPVLARNYAINTDKASQTVTISAAEDDQGKDDGTDDQGKDDGTDDQGKSDGTDDQGKDDGTDDQGKSDGTDDQGQSGSTDGQGQSGSADSQGHSNSADSQGQSGSANGQSQSDSANSQGQSDSANGQDQSDSANGQSQSDSANGQDQSDSANGQDQSNSNDNKSKSDTTTDNGTANDRRPAAVLVTSPFVAGIENIIGFCEGTQEGNTTVVSYSITRDGKVFTGRSNDAESACVTFDMSTSNVMYYNFPLDESLQTGDKVTVTYSDQNGAISKDYEVKADTAPTKAEPMGIPVISGPENVKQYFVQPVDMKSLENSDQEIPLLANGGYKAGSVKLSLNGNGELVVTPEIDDGICEEFDADAMAVQVFDELPTGGALDAVKGGQAVDQPQKVSGDTAWLYVSFDVKLKKEKLAADNPDGEGDLLITLSGNDADWQTAIDNGLVTADDMSRFVDMNTKPYVAGK